MKVENGQHFACQVEHSRNFLSGSTRDRYIVNNWFHSLISITILPFLID